MGAIEILKEELSRLQSKEPRMWTAIEQQEFNRQISELISAIDKLKELENKEIDLIWKEKR